MGKLVKKAELVALGTFGIILFSSTHLPALLTALDATTSPETYTATAYTAVDTNTAPVEVTPSPTATVTVTTASSTPDSTLDVTQVNPIDEPATLPTSDTTLDASTPTDTTDSANSTR